MDEGYSNDNYDNYYVPQKSTFVTVLAIIFIVLAGISLLGILAQYAFSSLLSQSSEISQRMQEQIDNGTMPAFSRFMYIYRVPFMILSSMVAFVELIASIGLLMRKNWARILFIVILIYLIAFRLLIVGAQLFAMPQLPDMSQSAAPFTSTFIMLIRIFTFIFAAGFCVLYGWIISKLLSQKIRMEFLSQMQTEEY